MVLCECLGDVLTCVLSAYCSIRILNTQPLEACLKHVPLFLGREPTNRQSMDAGLKNQEASDESFLIM